MATNDQSGAPADKEQGIVIDDQDIADVPALPVPKEGETVDWKAEAEKYQGMATRRGTTLKKLKTPLKPNAPAAKPDAVQDNKPADLDFGQKAYLVAKGIQTPKEEALVKDWMKDTGRPLDAILGNARFQAELTELREAETTAAAVPGNPSSTAQQSKGVEYWATRPFSEVPADMKMKVIEYRKGKEGGNKPDF